MNYSEVYNISLVFFNLSFDDYPQLKNWCERLMARDSWKQTLPDPQLIEDFKPRIKSMLEKM